jgi:hypothetical protein
MANHQFGGEVNDFFLTPFVLFVEVSAPHFIARRFMKPNFFVLAMRCMIALGLALTLPSLVAANCLEETLVFYLAKSDVVVLGEFAGEPIRKGASKFGTDYQADFKIAKVLKWDAPGDTKAGATIKVNIVRTVLHEADFEPEDQLPDLKKGGKCILFLTCYQEKPTPSYITADIWFGVQRPSSWMAKSLARIVAEQTKRPLRVPEEKEIEQVSADRVGRVDTSKNFKLDKADLLRILRDYHVLPKHEWKKFTHYFEERTGTIRLRDGTKIEYLVYPAGLATLTFPDGRKLYLSRAKALKLD